jgi:hypothetical protein
MSLDEEDKTWISERLDSTLKRLAKALRMEFDRVGESELSPDADPRLGAASD